jgi:protein SCO1/2
MMARALTALIFSLLLLAALPPAGWASETGHDSHGASQMTGHEMDHGAGHGNSEKSETMGHSDDAHQNMMDEAKAAEKELAAKVLVKERLGEFIDFSASFVDAKNRPVDLKTVFDKPVVILPVYFMCNSICNFLQAELANVLNLTDDLAGKDFNVISLSFSDDEDASHARSSKRNYANLVKRDIDLDNWYYLTGDRENILKLTDSLGYYFVKQKKNFYIHPSAMVVAAQDGKIIRYLYGPNFLPFDVGMALSEARKGEPGISIKRGVLSFCFDYDPENKTYVFKMFRITGTAILVLLAGFVFFLIRPSKSKKRRGLSPPGE